MKIAYFLRDNGACGHYRVDLPLLTVAKNKAAQVLKVEKGDSAEKIEKAFSADVIVVPRPGEAEMLQALFALRMQGKRIVVDHDDDMFNVSPFSPHYEEFGVEEVKVVHEGKTIPLWVDGKNFNIKRNQERLDNIKRGVEMADCVTVTTENLAQVYREYNGNVKVLPNCVDAKVWKQANIKRDSDEVRLYWSGGNSHYQDWVLIQDAIPKLMDKHPNIKLVIMGAKFDGTLKALDASRIEYHGWVHTQAYPYKTALLNPDIAIIPLEDNVFNRGKSAIKWIEMGSLAVPCASSLVSPYKEVYTGTNGVFVEDNDVDGWVDGVSALVEDKMLRWKIGGEAQATVKQHFDINTQYHRWVDTYKELL